MSTIAIDPARSQDKKDWLAAFEGAFLRKSVTFKNLQIRTLFHRNFEVLGRATYFISARARAILKSEEAIAKVEEHLSNTFRNQTLVISNLLGQLNKIKDAAGVTSQAFHNQLTPQEIVVVTGYQTKFLKMLTTADEAISLLELLWLEGEIEPARRAECMWTIKRAIRSVTTSSRMLQSSLLKRRNEQVRAANDSSESEGKDAVVESATVAAAPSADATPAANMEPVLAAA